MEEEKAIRKTERTPGDRTLEGRAKTKNGIKRLVFAALSMLLQVLFFILLLTRLKDYAAWISVLLRVVSVFLVLGIYSQQKTNAMKMPWIILIMALPVVGITMYLLVGLNGGTRIMRRRYEEIDAALLPRLPKNEEVLERLTEECPEASGISRYLRDYARYPVYRGTKVTYYPEAAFALEAQLRDLERAKRFIFMEYYAIEDSCSWGRIEEVLARKAAEGVEVRVFYDDIGSIGFINTDFIEKLEGRGISCRVFNPLMPGLNFFLNNRDHRKLTVIDGRVGYTGGYNLADEYFGITHPYGQWKDTGIRLEGEAVRSLTAIFLEMWHSTKDGEGIHGDYPAYMDVSFPEEGERSFVQPYADNPLDEEHVGEEVYISMAENARRYCYFTTPYLIITDEMAHALALAAKRGIDVRIITPGIPDKRLVYSVTRSFYAALARDGVRIYEWQPGFCHCKMSLADDRMATVGTINLDYRSLYHHFENGCFIVDREIAGRMRADFEQMFSQSMEVTARYMAGRGSLLRLEQLFLRLFAELL